ncbi:hypothetical protein CU086_00345 [Candidatus Nasuia deltocephalinicola]|uniref:DNA-directed RNA polymerase n=1 Tax=Candidatus Nasuia deltocephalincola TaxID=1160784 RepID=A0A974WKM3_9PROT|nr:hypothetical protein CU086_00345 [Candidatus Nasuia deltocephalinicola]
MFNFIFNKTLPANLSENIQNNINLLDIFNLSYKNFLNLKLNDIFNYIFPIYVYKSNFIVDIKNYKFIYSNKSIFFCLKKGLTYSLSLKITFNIFYYNIDIKSGNLIKSKIKEDYILIPNIPLITKNSTFIIDGVEKSLVSRFVRAPGIYFLLENKLNFKNYIIKIVPDIGYEVDFVLDYNNFLYLKFKNKKLFLIDILKCYGLTNKEIINNFYNSINILVIKNNFKIKFEKDYFLNYSFPFDILDLQGKIIVKKNNIILLDDIEEIEKNNLDYILICRDFLINKHISEDLYFNNLKFVKSSQLIDNNLLDNIINYNIRSFNIIVFGSQNHYSILKNLKSFNNFFNSLNNLNNFLNFINLNIFDLNILNSNFNIFNKEFFISTICRKKMNFYFKKNYNFNNFSYFDIINIIKLLISFKDGIFKETDLLNIGNLNFYMIGESLGDIFLNFFINLKKIFNNSFINLKKYNINIFFKVFNLVNKIKKFFSISKYCQYLDQVNILSEISHKRRVSFLGVIGISKKYSGFNQRDLNISHYSRLCPIETPEGINIGLVGSLAILCRVDKYNFLVSPYYKIINGKISKKIFYLSVDEEFNSFISESKNFFRNFDNIDHILSKFGDQLIITNKNIINYVNLLPYQILSAITILIPFLENNDSNRALMASNMLRQALPLINPEPPLISTGLENLIFNNNSNILKCYNKSILNYVDSRFIIMKSFFHFKNFYFYNYDLYFLIKYLSSNQKTVISQKFNFSNNNKFYKNDYLLNDSCFNKKTLSLGKNVLVAFMSWEGYNFEDSIIVSDSILFDDKYTSLEITQIDVNVFMVNGEPEYLTKNVISDNFSIANLDDFGLVKLGSKVFGGDILVGKARKIFDDFEEIDPNHRLLYSVFLNQNEFNKQDTSFYLPEKFSSGIITSLEIYFSDNYNILENDKKLLNYQNKKILHSKSFRYFFLKKKIKNLLIDFLIGKEIIYKNDIFKINYIF